MRSRDLTRECDLSDAFHAIDRALLSNDPAALAAWAAEFARPACEAVRSLIDNPPEDGEW